MHGAGTDESRMLDWIVRYRKPVVLIPVLATTVVLIAIWWHEPPHAAAAKGRAAKLQVVAFDLGRLDDESIGTRKELLLRATSGSINRLLFRRGDGSLVAAYDASDGSLTWSTPTEWMSADGEMIDDRHVGVGDSWNLDESRGQLTHRGRLAQTVARIQLHAQASPGGDKVAVITADGRFDPGEIGMIFGGSHKQASGRHYVEILSNSSGKPLMEPVAIPFRSGKQRTVDVLWSADERFVICRSTSKYCVIPTGFERLSSSR